MAFLYVLGLGIGSTRSVYRAMIWQRTFDTEVRCDASNERNGEVQARHALDASSSGFRRLKCGDTGFFQLCALILIKNY
jgi:hypothetical protein